MWSLNFNNAVCYEAPEYQSKTWRWLLPVGEIFISLRPKHGIYQTTLWLNGTTLYFQKGSAYLSDHWTEIAYRLLSHGIICHNNMDITSNMELPNLDE